MSLAIESGLFTLDLQDYHAILGVPVDADPKDIRKKYLKLAQRLHPDSRAKESEDDRKRAAELLSKLVNPAYEQLSKEKNYTEHLVLLKLKGQQALRQQETVMLVSNEARKLAGEFGEIDNAYRQSLKQLAADQYNQLDSVLDITGRISELNLVYLMRKSNKGDFLSPNVGAGKAAAATPGRPATAAPAPKPPSSRESVLSSYLRRAQELETQQNYTGAIKELRDALQIAPRNGTIHSRLGVVYLRSNQTTMAKIHFRKALELNPQDAIAQEGLRRVDPAAAAGNAAAPANGSRPDAKATRPAPRASAPNNGNKPEAGGGLFGLFGRKK